MLSSTTSSLLLPFVPPVNHNLPRQNIEIAFQSIMASVNEPCIQRLNKLRVHMQVAQGALCILPHEWCVVVCTSVCLLSDTVFHPSVDSVGLGSVFGS